MEWAQNETENQSCSKSREETPCTENRNWTNLTKKFMRAFKVGVPVTRFKAQLLS